MNKTAYKTIAPNGPVDAGLAIRLAADALDELCNSRHIVFTSPSPSSTEAVLKRRANQCLKMVDELATLWAAIYPESIRRRGRKRKTEDPGND